MIYKRPRIALPGESPAGADFAPGAADRPLASAIIFPAFAARTAAALSSPVYSVIYRHRLKPP